MRNERQDCILVHSMTEEFQETQKLDLTLIKKNRCLGGEGLKKSQDCV